MLAVACIKQVPDTTQVKVDPATGTLVRGGVPFIMNPFDAHALEESLRLKDRYGLRVVVISMGPPNTEVTMRKAMALGADGTVLLSDRAFGGADTLAASMVLAEAIRRLDREEEVAVVLCSQQTIDGDTAQVGPGIATRLGYSQLTLINRIEEMDLSAKQVKVRRKMRTHHAYNTVKISGKKTSFFYRPSTQLTAFRKMRNPSPYSLAPCRVQRGCWVPRIWRSGWGIRAKMRPEASLIPAILSTEPLGLWG